MTIAGFNHHWHKVATHTQIGETQVFAFCFSSTDSDLWRLDWVLISVTSYDVAL